MQDDYYQDYDEEEEWDREQLLDPAWEKQQKKVCPPWMIHPHPLSRFSAHLLSVIAFFLKKPCIVMFLAFDCRANLIVSATRKLKKHKFVITGKNSNGGRHNFFFLIRRAIKGCHLPGAVSTLLQTTHPWNVTA